MYRIVGHRIVVCDATSAGAEPVPGAAAQLVRRRVSTALAGGLGAQQAAGGRRPHRPPRPARPSSPRRRLDRDAAPPPPPTPLLAVAAHADGPASMEIPAPADVPVPLLEFATPADGPDSVEIPAPADGSASLLEVAAPADGSASVEISAPADVPAPLLAVAVPPVQRQRRGGPSWAAMQRRRRHRHRSANVREDSAVGPSFDAKLLHRHPASVLAAAAAAEAAADSASIGGAAVNYNGPNVVVDVQPSGTRLYDELVAKSVCQLMFLLQKFNVQDKMNKILSNKLNSSAQTSCYNIDWQPEAASLLPHTE